VKTVTLKDQPICITGASAGIGKATAIQCARAGMPVVLAARREDRLKQIVEDITSQGGQATAIACDVNDPDQCSAMVQRCLDAYGSVYAVLANAGYGFEAPIHQLTDQQLRDIFETNFFGTMNTIRPALPHMLSAGRGHVLITSSSIGIMPIARHGHYCATKAAQHHIGRAMAWELRDKGIRVSTIHPIGTRTEFFEKAGERTAGGTEAITNIPTPNGASGNTPNFFMQDADTVARAILNCLRRPRAEVWPGGSWWVRMLMAGTIAFPALADLAMKRRG